MTNANDIATQASAVLADSRFTADVQRLLVDWDEGDDADTTGVWAAAKALGLLELQPGEDHAMQHTPYQRSRMVHPARCCVRAERRL